VIRRPVAACADIAVKPNAQCLESGQETSMKSHFIRFATIAALAAAPLASHALGTNEKGCLVGGAAGGVAGHLLGSSGTHTAVGAALGCGAGVLVNKERVKRVDAKEQEKKVAAQQQRKKRQQVAQRQQTTWQ